MFSKREEKIIKSLGDKEMTTRELADAVFKNEDYRPVDDTVSIMNSVNRIFKKCRREDLPWLITKKKSNGKTTILKVKVN